MSKILVTYFSASGVTKIAAKKIADVVQGELFEIQATAIPLALERLFKKSNFFIQQKVQQISYHFYIDFLYKTVKSNYFI